MNETAYLAIMPAGGVIKLVLNALDRVETRQEKFLANHMSSTTRALEDLASAVRAHTSKSELDLLRMRVAMERGGHRVPEAEDDRAD